MNGSGVRLIIRPVMNYKSEFSERYSDLYTENKQLIQSSSTEYINSFREEAIERYRILGIPSRKSEMYRYTNLDIFFRHDFKNYLAPDDEEIGRAHV